MEGGAVMSKRPCARFVRRLLRMEGAGIDELASLAFDAAAMAAHKGAWISGYRPAGGNTSVAVAEIHAERRGELRRLSPSTLERVALLAWRAWKALEARPVAGVSRRLLIDWSKAAR